MSDFQEIFDNGVEAGKSEDEIVLDIYQASSELSVKDAQAEYYSLATAAGVIQTPSQKKASWEEQTEGMDMSDEEDVASARAVGDELEIGATTITKYIKAKAEADGVVAALPSGGSRGASMSGKLVEWLIANPDASDKEIVAQGVELGMSEVSAKYYVRVFAIAKRIAA